MTDQVSVPLCAIDFYPFEGGPYTINSNSGQILSVSTRKDIRADAGEFTIVLAPGGPNGTEMPPSWTEVITPMSFIVIAMARGDDVGIPMLGVVTSISEPQDWQPGGPVTRNIIIQGKDFSYFFQMFSYYSLWFLGANGAQLGNLVPSPSEGLPTILGAALVQGPPASVGSAWFNTVMAGASGILANTFVPYQNGRVTFSDAMGTVFEPYPAFILPYGDSFIGYEGSWLNKFRQIFAFPWYEFFINTVPTGFYGPVSGVPGFPFYSSLLGPEFPFSPTLVARLNPAPRLLSSSVDPNGSGSFDGLDTTAWNNLPLYQADTYDATDLYPFISSSPTFSEAEVLNTFLINPTWFRALFGGAGTGGNSNIAPLLLNFSAAGDVASIHRYGFRIANGAISWFSDLTGGVSQGQQVNLDTLMADIIGRFASFYEPLSLMARDQVVQPLRPDIVPGSRFRHQPFKNEPPYDFYIEGVANDYRFGGPSTTTLSLSRGLPSSVYQDTSTAILFNALKGNAMRQNGQYVVGTPPGVGNPLAAIPPTQMQSWLSQIAPIYGTPQMTAAASGQ